MDIGSTEWKNLFNCQLPILNQESSVGDSQFSILNSQFSIYATELLKWNQKINLTSITDPEEIAVKHFIDSIAPVPLIPPDASKLLDIGSGGGFPGIPIKLMRPYLSVTLVESSQKKVNFQKHIIRTLNLEDIEAIHIRAEELAKKDAFKNTFDVVICRALAALDKFVLMSLPLVAKGGMIIAMKGKLSETEKNSVLSLKEIKEQNYTLTLHNYTLPYLNAERTIFALKRP